MMDIFYFGAHLQESLFQTLGDAGYQIIQTEYSKGIFGGSSNCGGIVLHWKSKKGQQIIEEAKTAGVPILVITSKLAAAVRAGEPFADLYLEEPASDEEVATMLIEMVTVKPVAPPLLARAAAH